MMDGKPNRYSFDLPPAIKDMAQHPEKYDGAAEIVIQSEDGNEIRAKLGERRHGARRKKKFEDAVRKMLATRPLPLSELKEVAT